jgi:hypothetical protein
MVVISDDFWQFPVGAMSAPNTKSALGLVSEKSCNIVYQCNWWLLLSGSNLLVGATGIGRKPCFTLATPVFDSSFAAG